jgi:hypothetical protein
MDSPSPSTQKRRLFSRSALGMTGMHDAMSIDPRARLAQDGLSTNALMKGVIVNSSLTVKLALANETGERGAVKPPL